MKVLKLGGWWTACLLACLLACLRQPFQFLSVLSLSLSIYLSISLFIYLSTSLHPLALRSHECVVDFRSYVKQ